MTGKRNIVLSLCDRTANMVMPWAMAGYDCICVDLRHDAITKDPDLPITYVGADVRKWLPPLAHYKIVFAFPPCTNLAISGARWFREKGLAGLAEGIEVVEACRRICDWAESPWLIENPVSTLSTYWREPDFTFNPCDFGGYVNPPADAYTKRTCLWAGGGFRMPEFRHIAPIEGSKMHLIPPSEYRADMRSATPIGFARAVYLANRDSTWEEQMDLTEATA